MARVWQTLFRTNSQRSSEISRYDLSWYLQQLTANPWGVYSGPSYTSGDGRTVEEISNSFTSYVNSAYKANGVIYAVLLSRRLLFSEARLQFRRLINGRPGDLFGTNALRILERPWPNATTGEMLARADQDVSLGGNFYLADEGERLRRLRPDWVQIVLTAPPDEAVESDVAGYMFTPGGTGSGAEPKFYLPDEIAHWSPEPDPDAQYRGMSWLTPVLREIEADQAATAHKSAFFRNGAKPGLVVSLKESIKEEQFKRFVRAMNESHQGADQAYKTLYLAGGADVTIAGADLRQLDFRATQGAGETRICAAGGVPPIIVGLSEGLQSATYSNYGMARRKFGDGWARPMWRSICAALETVVDVPGGAQLWYDDRDIAFLREDQKDAAEIAQVRAATINAYITNGFTPESAVLAVMNGDESLLIHTGLVSVQLQPPGNGVPETDPALAGETAPEGDVIEGEVVAGELESGVARHLPGRHDQSTHGRRKGSRVTGAAKKAVAAVRDAVTGEQAVHAAPHMRHTGFGNAPTGSRNGVEVREIDGALNTYKSAGYLGINEDLRKGDLNHPDTKDDIRAIDAGMGPLRSDVEVYRGIRKPQKVFGDAWNDTDVTGLEWRDKAYVSTSGDGNAANRFFSGDNGVVMRIIAPKGTNAVGISDYAEMELLLDRGLKFRVVADHGVVGDRRRLDVEVVPE